MAAGLGGPGPAAGGSPASTRLADDIRNAGGTWIDDEVVVDGNLITSRSPDDLPAFVKALEDALT